MKLKRHHEWEDGTAHVTGVEVLHYHPEQNFSTKLVEQGRKEGWLRLASGELIIDGINKTLKYDILREPGRYEGEQIHYYECKLKGESRWPIRFLTSLLEG